MDGSKLAPPSTLTNSVANQPPTRSILTGLSVIKPPYCGSMPFLKTWIWPTFALPCYWTQEATAISQERVFHEVGIPSSNQSSLWSTRHLRCPSQRGRSSHPFSGSSSTHLSPLSDVHSNPVSSWSCLVRRAPHLVVCEELNLADDTTAESFASFSVTRSNPQRSSNHGRHSSLHPQQRGSASSNRVSHGASGRTGPSFSGPASNARTHQSRPVGSGDLWPRPHCQICGKWGHVALGCYHHMDHLYQGRHPPQRLAAMLAVHQPTNNNTWYSDTGATHHVTSDLG